MQIIFYIIIFILGLVLGSFYNVVGYRIPKKESIVFPPSHCPNCNHKLKIKDLFPVFSYIFLKGKCRYCKKKISIIYPIIEILTASLFTFSYYLFGLSIELLISLVFISILIITIVSDTRYMIIEDSVLIIGELLLLVITFFGKTPKDALNMIINGIISFAIILLIKLAADFSFKREAMGGGDVKLTFIIGSIISWPMSILNLCFASFIAFPYAIYVLFSKKENLLPLGPFLCISALIIYFLKLDFNTIMNIMAN